jgi:DNA-binding LacI/PurR family transcriptional regulator
MADVAARAGVSHQTVSRVLNNQAAVSAATRAKVRAAIEDLGYRRNLAARTLATGNSGIIGVLVSSTNLSGPSGSLLAIEQNARSKGFWVSMASLQGRGSQEVADVISHFIDQGVDGLIAVAQTESALEATLRGAGDLPTVLVTSGAVDEGHSTLDIDQAGGARMAMTLLKGLGHTQIAHLAGPSYDLHAAARLGAWRESLLEGDPGVCFEGDWSSNSGYLAMMTLLAQGNPPSAVFVANDQMAFGALRALHEAGLRIPQDISVIGFDDIDGSDCSFPPLTTIRQNHDALGEVAIELLVEAINGLPARSVKIPAELITRSSTGSPGR